MGAPHAGLRVGLLILILPLDTSRSDRLTGRRVARASTEEMKWGAPHVGFTCGSFGLAVPTIYPPTGSIETSRVRHTLKYEKIV